MSRFVVLLSLLALALGQTSQGGGSGLGTTQAAVVVGTTVSGSGSGNHGTTVSVSGGSGSGNQGTTVSVSGGSASGASGAGTTQSGSGSGAATTASLPASSTLVYFAAYANQTNCNAGIAIPPGVASFTPSGACQLFTALPTGGTTIYVTSYIGVAANGPLVVNLFAGASAASCAPAAAVGSFSVANNICTSVTPLGTPLSVKAWWTAGSITTGVPATTGSSAGATVSVGLATMALSLLAALLL